MRKYKVMGGGVGGARLCGSNKELNRKGGGEAMRKRKGMRNEEGKSIRSEEARIQVRGSAKLWWGKGENMRK
jgi:hypothetical protein